MGKGRINAEHSHHYHNLVLGIEPISNHNRMNGTQVDTGCVSPILYNIHVWFVPTNRRRFNSKAWKGFGETNPNVLVLFLSALIGSSRANSVIQTK